MWPVLLLWVTLSHNSIRWLAGLMLDGLCCGMPAGKTTACACGIGCPTGECFGGCSVSAIVTLSHAVVLLGWW